jgi:hypothetical protein
VFIAVYETGNLGAVARTLSRTQSAVSQHIRRLEQENRLSSAISCGSPGACRAHAGTSQAARFGGLGRRERS